MRIEGKKEDEREQRKARARPKSFASGSDSAKNRHSTREGDRLRRAGQASHDNNGNNANSRAKASVRK